MFIVKTNSTKDKFIRLSEAEKKLQELKKCNEGKGVEIQLSFETIFKQEKVIRTIKS